MEVKGAMVCGNGVDAPLPDGPDQRLPVAFPAQGGRADVLGPLKARLLVFFLGKGQVLGAGFGDHPLPHGAGLFHLGQPEARNFALSTFCSTS